MEKQNTNRPFGKTLKNQQNMYYVTVFIGQRSGCDSGDPFALGLWQGCSQDVGQSSGHLRARGGRIHFQDHLGGLLAGLSSLYAAGLKASILCWLLARRHSQFLARWAYPEGSSQHGTGFIRVHGKTKSQRESWQGRNHSLLSLNLGRNNPSILPHSIC